MNTHQFIIAQSANGGIGNLIMPLLLIIIFWVVLIRPQQKRAKEQRERQANLKKGDKVITIGGMHAIVNAVSDSTVSLKVSDGNFVKYDKTAIASVVNKEKPSSDSQTKSESESEFSKSKSESSKSKSESSKSESKSES